jgi:hypothetical protein
VCAAPPRRPSLRGQRGALLRPQAQGACLDVPLRSPRQVYLTRSSAALATHPALRPISIASLTPPAPAGPRRAAAAAAAAALAASLLLGPAAPPAAADFRLPPIDSDPNRCARGFVGNTIGQANAVSDKILDLRKCDYSGKNLSGKVLAGALMSDANFAKTNLQVRGP